MANSQIAKRKIEAIKEEIGTETCPHKLSVLTNRLNLLNKAFVALEKQEAADAR